jgi:hypothetical protein
MEYAFMAILTLAAIMVIAYPLVNPRRYLYEIESTLATGDVRQLNYLNSKKELVLSNLKELDFDHDMGKLSEEDYARLRNDYLHEAQDVVQSIDQLKVREEIEYLIEGDVRSRRRTD